MEFYIEFECTMSKKNVFVLRHVRRPRGDRVTGRVRGKQTCGHTDSGRSTDATQRYKRPTTIGHGTRRAHQFRLTFQ